MRTPTQKTPEATARINSGKGKRKGVLLLLSCAGLWTACSTTKTELQGDSLTSGSFSLTVRSPDAGDANSRMLPSGSVLHNSDRYVLDVSVREPLYLYVEQRTDAGIAPLWPSSGERMQAVQPGSTLSIPPSGFLTLDSHPKTVWLYAAAANQPLSLDEVRNEIDRVANSGERGSGGGTTWGHLNARGIGVVQFKLVHR